ncbi:MAG: hypothetical protein WKF45_07850 [Ilumatobacteraceae bacterium]
MSSLPPPAPGARPPAPTTATDDTTGGTTGRRDKREANARRRANMVMGLVLAIALAFGGFVLFRTLRSQDDEPSGSFNRIVTVDDDVVTILDADGEVIEEVDVPEQPLLQAMAGRYLALGGDAGVSILDVDTADVTETGAESNDRLRWIEGDRPVLATFPSRGGALRLTRADDGEEIDVVDELAALDGDFDPRSLLGDALVANDGGDVFAVGVPDGRVSTTVLFGFDRNTLTLPGSVVALTGDQAVVFEPRGDDRGRLSFYDLDGEVREQFSGVSAPAVSPVVDGDTITFADRSGRILRASPDGDDVEELDAVDVGRAEIERQYRIGDRLLFQTDAPTLVVHDADGAEVGTVDGTLDLGALTASGGGISASRECLIMATDAGLTQFRIDGLEELTDSPRPGAITKATPDLCAFVTTEGALVVDGADVDVPDDLNVGLIAPDAGAVVLASRQGTEVHFLDDPDATPIELGRVQAAVLVTV